MDKRIEQTSSLHDIYFVMLDLLSGTPVRSLIRRILQALRVLLRFGPIPNDDHGDLLLILVPVYILLQREQHVQGFGFRGVVDQDVSVGEAEVMSRELLIVRVIVHGLQSRCIVKSHFLLRAAIRFYIRDINILDRGMDFLLHYKAHIVQKQFYLQLSKSSRIDTVNSASL